MKQSIIFSCFFFLISSTSGWAQEIKDAGSYMSYMSLQYRGISQDFVSYVSAVAHGKSARKVSKRRDELLKTSKDAIQKISALKDYKGDRSLRDSAKAYLQLSYHVLNEDYGKIMNLEAIAEESYDKMEAYLKAQEIASDKLKSASERLRESEKAFAAKNNVNLVTTDDELSKKMDKIRKVNEYYEPLYLLFFKSYKQDVYLTEAISKKSISSIEQNNNSLRGNADEALQKLTSIQAFEGDQSLIIANKQIQNYYKDEAAQIPALTKFFLKEENFNKMKKAFEAKKPGDRTQKDVDEFNKGVQEINQAVNDFNQTNATLNNKKNQLIENWNKAATNFLDKHTPK